MEDYCPSGAEVVTGLTKKSNSNRHERPQERHHRPCRPRPHPLRQDQGQDQGKELIVIVAIFHQGIPKLRVGN